MAQSAESFGEWPLKRLMTDVVGSGHKSADDMTREQAMEAFHRILEGEPDPTTLGAFWLANRWKRNTPEELAAFVDVMRRESVRPGEPSVDPVDCGANYDGKHTTALLGVGAGILAASVGTPVVTHSGDRVPTQKACAYKHVLDALDIETDLTPSESAKMVDETNFGYYYQPAFNPGIDALYDRRDQMGVRTFVNTIETLANPSNASIHLGSFYHLAFAKRMIDLIRESQELAFDRVIMFQGMEGYDDIRPGYTKVAEWDREGDDDGVIDYEIESTSFGLDFESEDLAVNDVPDDSARVTEEVLSGERNDHFHEGIVLNAAMRIYAKGEVSEIDDGIRLAREAIADGRAEKTLESLRSFD